MKKKVKIFIVIAKDFNVRIWKRERSIEEANEERKRRSETELKTSKATYF